MDYDIRFCRTAAGARIAYQTLGTGPVVTFSAWWFNHLELMWESASARAFFEALAAEHTVVLYDRQGTGLSDRERTDFSIAGEVQTLARVLAAAGVERTALFGFSQGGPTAVSYAVTYPEQVSHLILFATTGRARPPEDEALTAAIHAIIRADWCV